MEISDDDIKHLGQLARLEFSTEQANLYKKQMADILGYVQHLDEVAAEGVAPMDHASSDAALRGDVATNPNDAANRDAELKGAPKSKDGFIVVPKVFE